jgi:hypothetical protein
MLRIVLLCLVLATSVAAAQPRGGSPAMIDSAQECRSFGGAWVAQGRSGWQFACQAPWARDECLRLGGAWTPMFGAPFNGICIAQVSELATGRQCTAAGRSWGPAGSPMPLCMPASGRVRPPVRKASDAGKTCDSQSDCSLGCVYNGPPAADGTNVLGHCRATDAPGGCFSMVEKGRLSGQICVN